MTDYDALLRTHTMNELVEDILDRIINELPRRNAGSPQEILYEALLTFFTRGANMAYERSATDELDNNITSIPTCH
jgi:hypothetical protein